MIDKPSPSFEVALQKEREAIVESLYAEHLEALMQEADMAVRCDVKDKEAYYKRLRTGSRGLLDAIRSALTTIAEEARREERERIRKSFDHWFKKGTEDVEDWAERVLTTANNK